MNQLRRPLVALVVSNIDTVYRQLAAAKDKDRKRLFDETHQLVEHEKTDQAAKRRCNIVVIHRGGCTPAMYNEMVAHAKANNLPIVIGNTSADVAQYISDNFTIADAEQVVQPQSNVAIDASPTLATMQRVNQELEAALIGAKAQQTKLIDESLAALEQVDHYKKMAENTEAELTDTRREFESLQTLHEREIKRLSDELASQINHQRDEQRAANKDLQQAKEKIRELTEQLAKARDKQRPGEERSSVMMNLVSLVMAVFYMRDDDPTLGYMEEILSMLAHSLPADLLIHMRDSRKVTMLRSAKIIELFAADAAGLTKLIELMNDVSKKAADEQRARDLLNKQPVNQP